jgi:hypothetical protein
MILNAADVSDIKFPHIIATRLLKTRCRFFLALSFGMSSTDQESAKTIPSQKPAGTLGWRERTIGAIFFLAVVTAMAGWLYLLIMWVATIAAWLLS